jgi:hypothetical protein
VPDEQLPTPEAAEQRRRAGVRGRLRWPWRRAGASAAAQPRVAAGPQGRFERVLFTFMGPPQLGDLNAPVRALPVVPVAPCPTCGQPYDEHEIVRDPRLTYTRCPRP